MSWYRFTLFLYFLCSSCVNAEESLEALTQKSRIEFENGQYTLASGDLKAALENYEDSMRQDQKAEVYGLLGLTYFQMNKIRNAKNPKDTDNAEYFLNQAIDLGGEANNKVRWLTTLASIHNKNNENEEANQRYQEAIKLSKGNLNAQLNIRLAKSLQLSNNEDRLTELKQISEALDSVKAPDDRARDELARLEVNLASQILSKKVMTDSEKNLAKSNFEKAKKDAKNQPRVMVEALDGLAQLAEIEKDPDEALRLNKQALTAAQSANARDLSINLELRQARLNQKPNGASSEALAAYMRAVDHIEAVRQDFPTEFSHGKSSFRTKYGNNYLELTDLLLQEAKKQDNEDQKQALLQRARKTVELLKQTEIEDFLGERCSLSTIDASKTEVPEGTAVIYPIILPDRLEILVGMKNLLFQFHKNINKDTLENLATTFTDSIEYASGDDEYKPYSKALYKLLIETIEPLLIKNNIKTLVVIPDRILNPIPMAALSDKNDKFLIEKYALITSPGLTLLDKKSTTATEIKVLLAGVSQPGNVVTELPFEDQLYTLNKPHKDALERKKQASKACQRLFPENPKPENEIKLSTEIQQKINKTIALLDLKEDCKDKEIEIELKEVQDKDTSKLLNTKNELKELKCETTVNMENELKALQEETQNDPDFKKKLQKKLTLDGVEKEIDAIKQLLPDTVVLTKENFSAENFNQQLSDQNYNVIHIASHGYFNSKDSSSFIMAIDKKIDIENLEKTLKSKKFKKHPLDMIVFSACQTAEGDEKVPMGLAGIAIKAKVGNALGSLWEVSDFSTPRLMEKFYESLNTPNTSKAQALQKAQLDFLGDACLKNPKFWSPFILVGTWQ